MTLTLAGLSQAVEDLAGVGHDEGVRVGRPRGEVDLRRVEVVQVDRADDVLGDAGGQGDRDPAALAVDLRPRCRRRAGGWSGRGRPSAGP